jgi:hypothetical protein
MRDDNDDQVQLFAAVWTPEGVVAAARGTRLDWTVTEWSRHLGSL